MTDEVLRLTASRRVLAVLVFAAASLVFILGAYRYYRAETGEIREEKYQALEAIAELKAGQILQWRMERLADVQRTARGPLVRRAAAEILSGSAASELRSQLREILKLNQELYHYSDALLIGPDGKVLLSAKDDPDPAGPLTIKAAAAAMRDHRAALSDFYRCPHGIAHIDAAAPVMDGDGRPIALIVFRSDAEKFLFPLIQSWPTPSPTAETLLFQREGEELVFLSEPRHREKTALIPRKPLTLTTLPAVQAVMGKVGFFEGKDYRGIPVLADLRPIPGSPWFMVAKVDQAEILAEAQYRTSVIAGFTILFILFAGAAAALAYRQNQAVLYRELYRSERDKREAEESFRATIYSIGDAVMVTDREGRVKQMNPVAEALAGWSEAEARGKGLAEVFRIFNEETGEPVEDPVSRVLREGMVVGLATHTVLAARDGIRRPIADSGAPIRGQDGSISGVVLVFRDQTGERAAQQAVRDSVEQFKIAFESANAGKSLTLPGGEINVNQSFADMLGYTREELQNKKWQDLTPPEDVEAIQKTIDPLLKGERDSVRFEKRYLHKSGQIVWADVSTILRRDTEGRPLHFITTAVDVTERKRTQEALNDSELRYRRLFETAKDGILILDAETGAIMDANPFLTALLGFSREQMTGKKVWELGFLKDVAASRANFAELQNKKYVRYENLPLETADGRLTEVEFVSNVYRVDHRKVIQCNIRDISERKRAEAAIRKSEEQHRLLFETMAQGVVYQDAEGKILSANPSAERILGLTLDQMKGRTLADPRWKAVREDGSDFPGHEHPSMVALKTGRSTASEVMGVYNPQRDETIWILFEAVPQFAPGAGSPFQVYTTFTDITDQKRNEKDLRQSEERYRLIADNMADVVSVNDSNLNFTYVSPSIERLRGFTVTESLGQSLEQVMTPETLARVKRVFVEEMELEARGNAAPNRTRTLELEEYCKDGTTVWVESVFSFIRGRDGRPIGILSITRDISERKRAEAEYKKLEDQLRQAQKMEAVGRLAGGVAHDFNNMLSVILTYSDLTLRSMGPSNPLYEDILEIKKAGERSAELTRQLLGFARRQTIAPKILDLNDTVASMLKMLRRLIGEDIGLLWKPAADLGLVNIDPAQLDQVLANLCVNARDAISRVGKITIETDNIEFSPKYCEDHPGFAPGRYIKLAVSDDGRGMDRDTLDQIFEPFFTTKELGKGTGLGLATVYGIVKQNEGFINVYSEPGKGTVFRIYLPRITGEGEEAGEETAEIRGGTETVLLVEDEPSILKAGQRILEELGYRVLAADAPSGAVALAAEFDGEINLLVTDVVMPEMNGRELAATLTKIRSGMKVLYMSGYNANVIVHHGVLEPGLRFIQKPFSAEALALKVREALTG